MTPRTTTRITGDVDEWLRANVAPGVKYKLLRHDGDVYFDPIYQDMPESLPESEGQICPDCRGSKTYVGLRERRDCPTCGGSGLVPADLSERLKTLDDV